MIFSKDRHKYVSYLVHMIIICVCNFLQKFIALCAYVYCSVHSGYTNAIMLMSVQLTCTSNDYIYRVVSSDVTNDITTLQCAQLQM